MPHVTWKKAWDVLAVLLIFSCTGTTAVFLSGKVSAVLGLTKWSLAWWIVWAVLIFPLYQILLLGFALIFGKYRGFRGRQVKILRRIKRWFVGRGEKELSDSRESG